MATRTIRLGIVVEEPELQGMDSRWIRGRTSNPTGSQAVGGDLAIQYTTVNQNRDDDDADEEGIGKINCCCLDRCTVP